MVFALVLILFDFLIASLEKSLQMQWPLDIRKTPCDNQYTILEGCVLEESCAAQSA